VNQTALFIIAYSLLAIAILLFLWALWWDALMLRLNRRPARRCPKCWYNLTHTPSRTCSECGYTADNENKLHKSRKRKRYIALAILLFLASQFTFIYPRVKKRGLIGAIPNWTLIALLPQLNPALWNSFPGPYWLEGAYTDQDKKLWQNNLWTELYERTKQDELDPLTRILLIRRCFRGDAERKPCTFQWTRTYSRLMIELAANGHLSPEKITDFGYENTKVLVRTPERWPSDLSVPVYLNLHYWNSAPPYVINIHDEDFPGFEGFKPALITPDIPTDQFSSITYSWNIFSRPFINRLPFWKKDRLHSMRVTVSTVSKKGTLNTVKERLITFKLPAPEPTPWQKIISPYQSQELNMLIHDNVSAEIRPTQGGIPVNAPYWFQIDFRKLRPYFEQNSAPTIGLTIEILQNNKVVLKRSGWIWTANKKTLATLPKPVLTNLTIQPGLFNLVDDPLSHIDFKTPATWQVRLTPNPIAALENINSNQYWQGDPITLPLTFSNN